MSECVTISPAMSSSVFTGILGSDFKYFSSIYLVLKSCIKAKEWSGPFLARGWLQETRTEVVGLIVSKQVSC